MLFGITGNLANRMLLPALYELVSDGQLQMPIVGITRSGWDPKQLRERVRESVAAQGDVDEEAFDRLTGLLRLASDVDYGNSASGVRGIRSRAYLVRARIRSWAAARSTRHGTESRDCPPCPP